MERNLALVLPDYRTTSVRLAARNLGSRHAIFLELRRGSIKVSYNFNLLELDLRMS